MAIGGSSTTKFGVTDTVTVGGLPIRVDPGNTLSKSVNWRDGDGANQVEDNPTKSHTLTGGSDSIDLVGGFTRLDGTAITATAVKELYLEAPSTNAANVTVSFNNTNGWMAFCTDDLILKPGTAVHMLTSHATGYAITASTADIVTVSGTAADVLKIGLGVNV